MTAASNQPDVTVSWKVTDQAPGLPSESMARTRQKSVPTGSLLVLAWLPVTLRSRTSGGVNAEEFATWSS